MLTPSRTILTISDDSLIVSSISGRGVEVVETIPWSTEEFEETAANVISKDCGGKPVLIINDMVEQHYRKEKVPRVSVLDKQNVINRKLQVAFPSYPVRAALPLKEKIKKTDKSLAADVYIFAAVPASEPFAKTMAAVRLSLAPIAGFCLLPVESADMIKKLSEKLTDKNDVKAQWTVFVGQHQSGGLRQIVTRNGELALTRMTPITENEEDSLTWAKEVHQEFQATMSYLTRFGFDQTDGLNVILISEPATGDMVEEILETPCNFHSITVEDAAKHLGVKIGSQENSHIADALHTAWIGRKSRFILPMKAKQIERLSKPRQMAMLASILLFFSAAFLAYQFINSAQALSIATQDLSDLQTRKQQLDLQLSKEVKRKEDLGYNIQLIQSALVINEGFKNAEIDILYLAKQVSEALGRDLRIDRFDFSRRADRSLNLSGGLNPETKLRKYNIEMQMTFPSTTNAERGNAQVLAFSRRLQTLLPGHEVKIQKLLEDYEYSEEIVIETGDAKKEDALQDFVAEILIEGPVIE
ncbi:MAG: hypothetical protein GC137_05195 [Alphaproteobacteria bacterium]|nr:hypothetical protein [Alphaproteobacteria bacterium]